MILKEPIWLFLALPVALYLYWDWRRKASSVVYYPIVHKGWNFKKTWKQKYRFVPTGHLGLSLLMLIIVFAQPRVEEQESRSEREGIAIQMVMDISSSMSQDIGKGSARSTRMEVAKQVLRDFVIGNGVDLEGRPDDMVGVITFARYSDIVCPLTHAHDALAHMVSDITINERPNEDGTAYGDAVALAAARLAKIEELRGDELGEIESRIVVLLTDGENNCGILLPEQASALANEWGIRIYAISISDPVRSGFNHSTSGLNLEETSAGDHVLYQMASRTGGVFRTAHDYESLKSVYAEIDQLEKSKIKVESFTLEGDASQPFVAASVGFLMISLALSASVFRGMSR